MRNKLTTFFIGTLAGLFAGAALAQVGSPAYEAWAKAYGPKPGMYAYSMTTETTGIPGMGKMKMPAFNMKQCLTQKDIDEGRQLMSGQKNAGFKCAISNFKAQGANAQYTQLCEGQGMKMSSTADLVQQTDKVVIKSNTTMQSQGMNTQSSSVMEIRRLGNC